MEDESVRYVFDDEDEPNHGVPTPSTIDSSPLKMTNKAKAKLNHSTDTHDYDSSKEDISKDFVIEDATIPASTRFANVEFGQSIEQIEKKLGHEIDADDYDKLCRTYAAILCERDMRSRNRFDGSNTINPADYKHYYSQLVKNEKVVPAYQSVMKQYEDTLTSEISMELDKVKDRNPATIRIQPGKSVNIRYKGKVAICEDRNNRVITIDNKNDVDLLRMKYRQDWLDKRFKDDIANAQVTRTNEDDFE